MTTSTENALKAVLVFTLVLSAGAEGASFGTSGDDWITDMVVLPDGAYVMIGRMNDEEVVACIEPDTEIRWILNNEEVSDHSRAVTTIEGDVLVGGRVYFGETEAFVARIDAATGEIEWVRHFPEPWSDVICVEGEYVGGILEYEAFVARIDGDGEIVWLQVFDFLSSVGTIVVTDDGVTAYGEQTLLKLSTDGDLLWIRDDIEVENNWWIRAGCPDGEGGAVFVGDATEISGDYGNDPLAMRLDADGEVLWINIFDHDVDRRAYLNDVARTGDVFTAVAFRATYYGMAVHSEKPWRFDLSTGYSASVIEITPDGVEGEWWNMGVNGLTSNFKAIVPEPLTFAGNIRTLRGDLDFLIVRGGE